MQPPERQADGRAVTALMARLSGMPPAMWGPSIIGFGRYHYRHASGREGDMCRIGFAPRKAELVFYLAGLDGWQKRADWAQMNAYEAFPPFAAAVIIAQLAQVGEFTINILAGLFIVFRILHGVFYIRDIGALRSLVWLGGFLCVIGLFIASF